MVKRNKDYAGRPCVYCKRTMLNANAAAATGGESRWLVATNEHVQCRSKRGSNDHANIAIACFRCNNLRSDLDYTTWSAFVRGVLQQYPNAPTILMRKMLRNFVEALAVHATSNSRAVKSALQYTLLTNRASLMRSDPTTPISDVEALALRREILVQQVAELDAQIEALGGAN